MISNKVLFIPLLGLFLLIPLLPIQSSPPAYAQGPEVEGWAVIIGISDYAYIGDTWYGRDNAQDLYEQLAPIWGVDHIRLLVDSEATKANIQDAIYNWLDPREGTDDVVLFYFSGHGWSNGYHTICPYDALVYYTTNDIRDDELDSWLGTLESESVVVILESCFSGGFIPELSASDLVILPSSAADESSWEDSALGHGVFSYYLLQAFDDLELLDTNDDHDISAEEVFYYVDPKVVTYTEGDQHPQLYDGYAGELVLFTLISATFGASPNVVTLIIEGTAYSSGELPASFLWLPGSTHVCVAPSTVSAGTGTRYVFTSWSDGETSPSRTISAGGTYTANYKTQHYLTVTSAHGSPAGEGWYDEGTTVQMETGEVIGADGTRYVFNWVVDGSTQTGSPVSVTMDAPHTAVSDDYKTQYYLTVTSAHGSPAGEGWYDEGTTASTGTAAQTVSAGNTRYIFLNWIVDGSTRTGNPVSVTMNAPHTAATNYKTQHYLTLTSAHGAPSGEGWYDEGATAQIETDEVITTDSTRYIFLNWIVDGSTRTGNPVSVTMNAPYTAATNYKTQYYLTVTSEYGDPQGADWYDSGSTSQISVTSPVGTIIRQVFTGWSGDSTATPTTTTVLMDGPKTVIANWRTDYLYLYILIGGVVGLAGVGLALAIPMRGGRKAPRKRHRTACSTSLLS